ncbi:hypothetical protein I203_105671 [Kwoniella mangroviensis CBS 8507]|uniref:uncharacterized protein n=1 Tax=Kwoniella mangroviensis CBS 8507 TaxID=1296122 RepID=UPI00080D161F|nr:uncharacterized protein I203_01483 [Kwoniella mangroviensis CBS 8507]OCF69619.1 hypothetical protein I203_01483 [Kwoniella mangroviensis CBS 8507]
MPSPSKFSTSSPSRSRLEAELQEATEDRDWDRVHELSERLASSTTRSPSTSNGQSRRKHDSTRTHFRHSDESSSSSGGSFSIGESLLSGLFTGIGVAAGTSIFGSLNTPRYECNTFSAPIMRTRTVYRPIRRHCI